MKIQFDIPENLMIQINILKAKKKFKTKKETLLFILKEYFKLSEPIKSLKKYFRE